MNIEELPVKRLTPTATLPTRAHPNDAGLDLYADEAGEVTPGTHRLLSTGVAVAVPRGHVGMVCPRSGLAAKHGVSITNSPGLVDAGYTGEVLVNLAVSGDNTYEFKQGDRIAQLVIVPITTPAVVEVGALEETERGASGHGDSGI